MMTCLPRSVPILNVVDEAPGVKTFTLRSPDGEAAFSPGQFFQISAFGYGEAPFTLCSSPSCSEFFQICVSTVGNVSSALQNLGKNDVVGVRGPFGRGFPVKEVQGRDILFVAGGTGIACLRSMILHCLEHHAEFGRLIVASGAKTPADRLFQADLERWHSDVRIELHETVDEADDSWQGRTGVVTDVLEDIELRAEKICAFVVGPPVVFGFAAKKLFARGMAKEDLFFSLERRFQCGVGKCGHCQINDLYVCQDGPVFSYARLHDRSEAVETELPG